MADPALQRYQIMESLGQGGQGQTYRAVDRETGEEVAVKVLSLPGQESWKAYDLFEREVATLESLDHPGIPRYRDRYSSEETGDFFLVMDLVPGEPLSHRIRDGKSFAPAELRAVLDQALDILAYLHARVPPVIHRDIKPANLLWSRDGRLSLVDFGGVRVAIRPEGGSTMIGTFGYMAPEQLHGEATPATDIYALGATMAALASGREAEALARDGLTIRLDDVMAPGPLRIVLEGMLEPDPRDRLGSVAAVRTVLEDSGFGASSRRRREQSDRAEGSDTGVDPGLLPAETVEELRDLPAPLSLFVWLFSAMASGLLIVLEVAILPLVYAILRATGVMRRHPEMPGRIREVRRSIVGSRRQMRALADHTDPTRDEPRRLPPSGSRKGRSDDR